ncbi:hypothetical protein [Bacillus thuringiensis]|uniref:hypothetical protein n=1 Tax=Bacillus thuringiensis TaxID=1428 RepID=UPI0033363D3B
MTLSIFFVHNGSGANRVGYLEEEMQALKQSNTSEHVTTVTEEEESFFVCFC